MGAKQQHLLSPYEKKKKKKKKKDALHQTRRFTGSAQISSLQSQESLFIQVKLPSPPDDVSAILTRGERGHLSARRLSV
jgi:hypothetical protein